MNTLRRIWRGWWRVGALAAATAMAPASASAQFCSNCILNSAVPQNATFNLTQGATIQGVLTVGTLSLTNMTVSGTLTAGQLVGGGAGITALNASALASGTVPSARVAGSYTGVTGLGVVTAGTWRGNKVLPAYGGTGADLSLVAAGAVPYFVTGGTLAALASPGGVRVLMTAGSGAAPVWTSSPTLTGQNFSAIPLTALASGTLPAAIAVSSNSIAHVQGAGVLGNISGGAAFLTVALPVANLAAGTLPTTNAASSVTVTGTPIGTFGGPTTLAQIRVGGDGRVYDAKQFNLVVYSTQVVPGPLPAGVTIAAADVTSGTLRSTVIASSIAASGVGAGTYGGAARALTLGILVDGRVAAVTDAAIALPPAQLTAGTLPGNVLVPAANVQAGALGPSVIASSLAVNGVAPGTYGSATVTPQITVGADGRITSATQFSIPGASTSTAFVDRFNDWHFPQTSRSSWTVNANLSGQVVTAMTGFSGPGTSVTNLTPANFNAGYFPSNVIVSSVSIGVVGAAQLAAHAVSTNTVDGIVQVAKGGTGNDWSATASGGVPYFSGTGALSVLAKSINGYTLTLAAGVPTWAAASSSATHLSGGTAGAVPYQSAPNVTTFLAATTNGYAMQLAAGVPSWVASVSSATNLAGGATGGLPYQSAANTSAFLAAGTNGYTLVMSGGLPAWSATSSSATNIVGGAANSVPYQTAANTTALLAAGNGVLQEVSSGAPAWTLTPTLTGTNITGVPSASILAGSLLSGVTLSTANVVPGFNAANELVQMSAGGAYPAASGAAITAITAANVSAGTLGPNVIASSVAVTAVTAGTYGSSGASHPNITIGVDGRVTAASNQSIAIAASQVTSGQLAIAQGGTNIASAGGTANRVLATTDGSTFAMGQILGPMVAASTIPVASLNQSGASANQVITWNGSAWAPATPAVSAVIFASAAVSGVATSNFGGLGSTCLTGSTITWTSNGIITRVSFSGTASVSPASGNIVIIGFYMDGDTVAPLSHGVYYAYRNANFTGSAVEIPVAFGPIDIKPSAGAHSLCMWASNTGGGTTTINPNAVGEFSVKE